MDNDDYFRPLFLRDQAIYELVLQPGDFGKKLDFLRLEKLPDRGLGEEFGPDDRQRHDRWSQVNGRSEFLGRIGTDNNRRRLLCITAAAGIGKSIALHQMAILRDSVHRGHLTVRVHFSQLPTDWTRYMDKPHAESGLSFLADQVAKQLSKLGADKKDSLPRDPKIEPWLRSLMRTGQFTLAVDGLDEVAESDGRDKAQALRLFLTHYKQVHCVVAGRPYAITETYWKSLFATHESASHDQTSEWEFCLTGMFSADQNRKLLGNSRFNQLSLLQGGVEFNPRTIEVLRTLPIEVFATLRSGADVYWHSIDRSLRLDREKPDKPVQTDLSINEIIDILSAIAITMVMWKHDPEFPTATLDPRKKRAANKEPMAEPVRQIDPPEFDEFQRRVFARLTRIYREWATNDQSYGSSIAKKNFAEIQRLNTAFLEFNFFMSSDPNSIQWRNATQRDFFAALWIVRSSSIGEREWFGQRQSSSVELFDVKKSRSANLADTWRFICGMPDEGLLTRDRLPPQDRWMATINPIFENKQDHSRSTELMYSCWPNLLRRAGFLRDTNWTERDLERAGFDANKCKQSSTDSWPRKVVIDFLDEYRALRDGSKGASKQRICEQDLESFWRNCNSRVGLPFRCGHSTESSNPERLMVIQEAFQLCAYQVTNRMYALFDPFHASRFGVEYQRYSPEDRCPAIFITWYDATMFAIWTHSRLPTEWEWEYASRGGFVNADGSQPIYFWGNDDEKLNDHAWTFDNSESRTHEVGRKTNYNGFGLCDMLGNVWELTSSSSTPDSNLRSDRGGSFDSGAIYARCSHRTVANLRGTSELQGFRIARTKLENG